MQSLEYNLEQTFASWLETDVAPSTVIAGLPVICAHADSKIASSSRLEIFAERRVSGFERILNYCIAIEMSIITHADESLDATNADRGYLHALRGDVLDDNLNVALPEDRDALVDALTARIPTSASLMIERIGWMPDVPRLDARDQTHWRTVYALKVTAVPELIDENVIIGGGGVEIGGVPVEIGG